MSTQFILWGLLVLPWPTLLWMTQDDVKRFMPAALFTAVTSGIIYQIGIVANIWYFREIGFPLVMYGSLPVVALWVLKFTYGQFWLYTITNAIVDLGFAFVMIPWFESIEILGTNSWTTIIVYLINFLHAALIYGYQMWQEESIRI